jgi:hypothetical protein
MHCWQKSQMEIDLYLTLLSEKTLSPELKFELKAEVR